MERAEFVCPMCRATVLAPAAVEGRAVPCPKCHAQIAAWPPPRVPAPPAPLPAPYSAPLPPPSPAYYPSEPTPQHDFALAYPPAALAAWAVAVVIALAGAVGCVGILATGEEQRRKLETELKKLEEVERRPYYDPWGSMDRDVQRIKKQAAEAVEMDRQVRSQAVANVVFATAFEVLALVVAGVFICRPPSPSRTAVVWGALTAGTLGLVGALLSQFAPMFGGFLAHLLRTPFSAAQLTLLSEHTLKLGLIGVVLGAGASALRARA